MRALARAIALGSGAGAVIGAAYLAGSVHKPPVRPAPAASGSLQAIASPDGRKGGSRPPLVAAPAVKLAFQPDAPLRDRFRVASLSVHAAAQPFRFQAVAEAPSDLHCLAEAVYFEARGEAAAGQQAVAQVVLNRVRHPAFPKTICAVVHQHTGSGCQFSFACTSRQVALNSVAWRRAETIASSEMHGAVMTAVGDATHFQSAHAGPFAGLLKVAQVGAHIFYRFGGHAGASAMFHQTPTASSEPAKTELARLEPAAAARAAQPVPAEGRVRVTLYPTPVGAPEAPVKPDSASVKLASTPPAELKPAPVAAVHSVPTPALKAADPVAIRPAPISLALAQS